MLKDLKLDFFKTNPGYVFLVLFSGFFAGFFFWSVSVQYNLTKETTGMLMVFMGLFSLAYLLIWLLGSVAISRFNELDIYTVLRKDAATYLPSLLFILYILRFSFQGLGSVSKVDVEADAINTLGKFLFLFVLSSTLSLKVMFFGINEQFMEKLETSIGKVSRKLIYLFIVIFVITFSVIGVLKFYTFQTSLDLGLYDQAVWNMAHGRPFEASMQEGDATVGPKIEGRSTLQQHVEPILLLITPLYILYQSPITLLILQVAVMSMGALPVYWLSKERLNSEAAGVVFSISYLLYPPINYIATYDFHPIALAIPFLLFAFYYFQKNDIKKFSIFLVLALFCKENLSLVVFMFGLYILFFAKKRRIGLSVSTLGLGWFVISMFVVVPYFKGISSPTDTSYHYIESFYPHLGDSFFDMIKTFIFRPIFVLKYILTPVKMGYLLLLFAPLGFAPFLSPSLLIVSSPIFAQNLLSAYVFQQSIYTQYNSGLIPFLFVSAIFGVRRLSVNKNMLHSALFFVLVCSVFSNVFFSSSPLNSLSPFPLSTSFDLEEHVITSQDRQVKKMMESIPGDAAVSAEMKFLAHLSHREDAYLFPTFLDSIDYVVIDAQGYTASKYHDQMQILLEGSEYDEIAEENGVKLFKNNRV